MKRRTGTAQILTVILAVFSVSMLSFHFYIKKYGEGLLTDKLYEILNNGPVKYKIEHDQIDIDLAGKQIIFRNLKIYFNEDVRKEHPGYGEVLINAEIPFLSITGISFFDLILSGRISADTLYVRKGKFKIHLISKNNKRKTSQKKSAVKPLLSLEKLIFENGEIDYFTGSGLTAKAGIKKLSVYSGRIILDRSGHVFTDVPFETKMPELSAKSAFIHFSSTGYTASCGTVRISSKEPGILVSNFRYKPHDKTELSKMLDKKGRFHRIGISSINLRDIDLNGTMSGKGFKARQALIINPDIFIFRDRNIVNTGGKKIKKLPQQIFRETGIRISIPLIRMLNAKVEYSELGDGEKRPESLIFTKLNSNIRDATNFPDMINKGIESVITFNTRVMGQSRLSGRIVVPVNNKKDLFSFSGLLEKTDPKIFNHFLKRNVRVRIDRGSLSSMRFSVIADRDRAEGKMALVYKDLKVSLLRKYDRGKKRKFKSFLANTFIHGSNPTHGKGEIRTGKIFFERSSGRSIFNYMWKCILSGIKSSILT